MAIDRIAKSAPTLPATSASDEAGHSRAEPTRAFVLESSTAPASAPTAAGPVSGSLEALRAGHIGLHTYLDHKVDEATAHLVAGLSPEHLQSIRAALRDRLETEPGLSDFIHAIGGTSTFEE